MQRKVPNLPSPTNSPSARRSFDRVSNGPHQHSSRVPSSFDRVSNGLHQHSSRVPSVEDRLSPVPKRSYSARGDWPQIDPNDDKDSFLDSDLEIGSDLGSLGHNGRERGRGEQHLPVAMRAPGGTTRGDLDLPALEAENSQTWKSFVDRSFMECGICLAGDSQRDNPSTFVNLLWCGGLGESEAEGPDPQFSRNYKNPLAEGADDARGAQQFPRVASANKVVRPVKQQRNARGGSRTGERGNPEASPQSQVLPPGTQGHTLPNDAGSHPDVEASRSRAPPVVRMLDMSGLHAQRSDLEPPPVARENSLPPPLPVSYSSAASKKAVFQPSGGWDLAYSSGSSIASSQDLGSYKWNNDSGQSESETAVLPSLTPARCAASDDEDAVSLDRSELMPKWEESAPSPNNSTMPISKEVVDKELLLQKLLGSTAGRVVVEAPVTPPGVLDRGTLLENLDVDNLADFTNRVDGEVLVNDASPEGSDLGTELAPISHLDMSVLPASHLAPISHVDMSVMNGASNSMVHAVEPQAKPLGSPVGSLRGSPVSNSLSDLSSKGEEEMEKVVTEAGERKEQSPVKLEGRRGPTLGNDGSESGMAPAKEEEVDDTIDHASQSGLKMQRRPQGARNTRQPEPGGPNGVVPPKSLHRTISTIGRQDSPADWRTPFKCSATEIGAKYGIGFGLYLATSELMAAGMLLVCVFNVFPLIIYLMNSKIPPHNHNWMRDVYVGSTVASVMHEEEEHGFISDHRELIMLLIAVFNSLAITIYCVFVMRILRKWNALAMEMDEKVITLSDYSLTISSPEFGDDQHVVHDVDALKENIKEYFGACIDRVQQKQERRRTTRRAGSVTGSEAGSQVGSEVGESEVESEDHRSSPTKTKKPAKPNSKIQAKKAKAKKQLDGYEEIQEVVVVNNNTVILQMQREKLKVTMAVKEMQLQGITPASTMVDEGQFPWAGCMLWIINAVWFPWLWKLSMFRPYYMAHLRDRLKRINRRIRVIAHRSLKKPSISHIFVTFKTEKALLYASKGAQGKNAPLFLHKHKLKMQEPCEPDEFQWDNAHITMAERRFRILGTSVLLLGLLWLLTMITGFFNFQDELQGMALDCGLTNNQEITWESDRVCPTDLLYAFEHKDTRMQLIEEDHFEPSRWGPCLDVFYRINHNIPLKRDGSMPAEVQRDCRMRFCYYCYCESLPLSELLHKSQSKFCEAYVERSGAEWGHLVSSVFMMMGGNLILFPLARILTLNERHVVMATEVPMCALKILVSTSVVNGLIPVILSASMGKGPPHSSNWFVEHLMAGDEEDYTALWYHDAGFRFFMNFVLQIGLLWSLREPVLAWYNIYKNKVKKKNTSELCDRCYLARLSVLKERMVAQGLVSLKDYCRCNEAHHYEPMHTFICERNVLEAFLSYLVNSNWPTRIEHTTPTAGNLKRLLGGVVYQYCIDHPKVDEFMLQVDTWAGTGFVMVRDAYNFQPQLATYIRSKTLSLQSLTRTKNRQDEARELRVKAGLSPDDPDPNAEGQVYISQAQLQKSQEKIDELTIFKQTLDMLQWPTLVGPNEDMPVVKQATIQGVLKKVLNICADDVQNFHGLKLFLDTYFESHGNKMDNRSLIGVLPHVRQEVQRWVHWQQLHRPRLFRTSFNLASRWGKLLSTVFISLFFAAGMPAICFAAFAFLSFQVLMDRWLLFNIPDVPLRVGDRGAKLLVKILPMAAVLHCVQGAWMLTSDQVPSWAFEDKDVREAHYFGRLELFNALPFILAMVVSSGLLFHQFLSAFVVPLMWYFRKQQPKHVFQNLPPLSEVIRSGKLKGSCSYRLQENVQYYRLARECVIGSLENSMDINQLFP